MAKNRSRDQQRRLHFVAARTLNQTRREVLDNLRRIRNEATKTPKDRIQLADDSVFLELEQTIYWQLRIQILVHSGAVVTANGKAKINGFNLDRYLSEVRIRSEEHTSGLQSPCNLVC